ncbi:FG-GAP repeat protein [Aeoliella sp. ICT_H6.2]|uniref:FG-GAP repeat protein n=1 Tax=Aeoliella straminimaris TaxID=2954799 RepID=A0A9X2FI59_9BACT|nr:FG-GAP repeat protein [Aeoliella straminimaris]MCO6046821.1 FG-GAP repeat protein [Aeoliella straminimaris]
MRASRWGLLIVANSVLGSLTAYGLPPVAEVPTLPADHEIDGPQTNHDGFGIAVGVAGQIGIVGRPYADVQSAVVGAATLVDLSTGELRGTLVAPDGESGDNFGISADISGTTAIVGAWNHSSNAIGSSGAAYLFDVSDPDNALFQHKLVASDAQLLDELGKSVAIDGHVAIAGAAENQESATSPGAAYVFDTTLGTELAILTPDDGVIGDQFGLSVDVSGNLAVVSSNRAAYLFDVDSGMQLARINSPSEQSGDGFGSSVAIDGHTVIVGANADDQKGSGAGAAYLFDVTDVGSPVLTSTLRAPDLDEVALFGGSVDIDGQVAVVGARGDGRFSNPTGAAYLFDVANGDLIARTVASDLEPDSEFGISVAIDASRILVGSDLGSDFLGRPGAVFVYSHRVPEPSAWCTIGSATACLVAGGRYRKLRRRN